MKYPICDVRGHYSAHNTEDIELNFADFPVISYVSLATPPVSGGVGNSNGVVSHLDLSLHGHCNYRDGVKGGIFPPEEEFT
jgi:hypothetical protein